MIYYLTFYRKILPVPTLAEPSKKLESIGISLVIYISEDNDKF
jgi:hypothetical protein